MSNSNENEMNMDEEGMGKSNIYVNLYGKVVQLDKIYLLEAEYPRRLNKRGYNGILCLSIKRSSILDKALEFCKKRAELRARHSNDERRLYHALRHFDPDFVKDIRGDDAIDLLAAASVLDIKTLVDLLFDDVVRMISDKTPEDIEKIFRIRYNGDATRFDWMNYVLDTALPVWRLKLTTTDREILKVSPAAFKNLPFEQQQYWVYGHILCKTNEALFKSVKQLSKEDEDAISEEWKEEEDKYGVRVVVLGQYPNDMDAYAHEDEDEDEDVRSPKNE